jgi:hypothetical protein
MSTIRLGDHHLPDPRHEAAIISPVKRPLGRVRGSVLLALPLAAFFVGPVLSGVGVGDGNSDVFLLSVLPTVLPLLSLVIVAVAVFRRTASALTASAFTAGSLALALVGAGVYLMIAWDAAKGS